MEKLETVVTSFLCKICFEVTMPNFETSSSYLESGATFHSLRSCKRTRISLREILVCSTLNNGRWKNIVFDCVNVIHILPDLTPILTHQSLNNGITQLIKRKVILAILATFFSFKVKKKRYKNSSLSKIFLKLCQVFLTTTSIVKYRNVNLILVLKNDWSSDLRHCPTSNLCHLDNHSTKLPKSFTLLCFTLSEWTHNWVDLSLWKLDCHQMFVTYRKRHLCRQKSSESICR